MRLARDGDPRSEGKWPVVVSSSEKREYLFKSITFFFRETEECWLVILLRIIIYFWIHYKVLEFADLV